MHYEVIDKSTGKRIESIVEVNAEGCYILHYPDGTFKEIKGKIAKFDPDFHLVLKKSISEGPRKNIFEKEPTFHKEGRIYTEGQEVAFITQMKKMQWVGINLISVYLPFEIERLIGNIIKDYQIMKVTDYSYSHFFSPLHFIGLRSGDHQIRSEIYFVSEGLTVTPVADIKIFLLPF